MKIVNFIILTTCLVGCNGKSQIKSEIENAFETVDKGLRAIHSEEYQVQLDRLDRSETIQQSLLTAIDDSNKEVSKNTSIKIIELTKQVEDKIGSIINQLKDAYTLNDEGEYNNKRDKSHVERILFEEKQGEQLRILLKTNIGALRKELQNLDLKSTKPSILLENNMVVQTTESWEDFNFKNMPVIAVEPILNKIKSDAILTRLDLLEIIVSKIKD